MENKILPDIRTLNLQEIEEWILTCGEKKFRAKQIYEWLWSKGAKSIDDMSNLGKELRLKLSEHFSLIKVHAVDAQRSKDGTIKYGLQLFDGHVVEAVLIPTENRMTACISSQVGCSLTCKFCATGYMKMQRNLLAHEIYDQVQFVKEQAFLEYEQPLTNIVLMGMGEPLLNYKNVMAGIEKITSPEGMNMASKRITLSTAGIAKMIQKLGDDEVKFEFALSLHAANDKKRNEIMPINESNSLPALKEALRYFYQKTGTRVTFEYIMFDGFNDSIQDARELYEFSKTIPCKINIIEYNPIAEAAFINTTEGRLNTFGQFLESKGLIVNVRRSRGKDVDAACGQLAIRKINKE